MENLAVKHRFFMDKQFQKHTKPHNVKTRNLIKKKGKEKLERKKKSKLQIVEDYNDQNKIYHSLLKFHTQKKKAWIGLACRNCLPMVIIKYQDPFT